MVSSKATSTGAPLKASIPEQVMPEQVICAVFYTQVCHIRVLVCVWSNSATNMLKSTGDAQIRTGFWGWAALQTDSPLGAAQPGWQISGEVVIRLRSLIGELFQALTGACTGVSQP